MSANNDVSPEPKTAVTNFYYACVNHIRRRKGKCAKRSVRKEKLEGVVTDVLASLLNDQELLASFAVDVASYYRSTHDDGAYLRSLQSELDDAERSIRNLVAAIERGALSDALLRRLEDTEQRAGLLRETIAAEEAKQSLVEDEYTIAALFEKFANANLGDAEVRDNVLGYFVDEIIVSDNRIDIVVDWLDYVGDTRFERTFTFDDVKTRFVPLREFEPSRDGRGGGTPALPSAGLLGLVARAPRPATLARRDLAVRVPPGRCEGVPETAGRPQLERLFGRGGGTRTRKTEVGGF